MTNQTRTRGGFVHDDSGRTLLTRFSISNMVTMPGDSSGKHHLVYGVLDLSYITYSTIEQLLGLTTAHTSDIRIDQLQVNRFWSIVKVFIDFDKVPAEVKYRIYEKVPDVFFYKPDSNSRSMTFVRSIRTSPTALVRAVCYALGVDQPIVNLDEEHRVGIRRRYAEEKHLAARALHVLSLADGFRLQQVPVDQKFLSYIWSGHHSVSGIRGLTLMDLCPIQEVLIGVLSADPDPNSWWLRD